MKLSRINALIPFLICSTASGMAADIDLEQSIAFCAAKSGQLERLQCYDDMAREANLGVPPASTAEMPKTGKWKVSDAIDPLSDKRTVALMLASDSGQGKWGDPIYLFLRCKNGSTNLYINWGDYLGETANVMTRVGKSGPQTGKWSVSTDGKGSFYPGSPVSLIRRMFTADQFVAQVIPYDGGPVTAVFDIRGLNLAAVPLMDACNWSADLTAMKSSVEAGLGTDDVLAAQTYLQKLDYFFTEPNGQWNIETEMAIKQFQTDKGLEPTGKLDAALLQLMLEGDPEGQ